ncbi:MAG: hypothetical protein WAK31_00665 [Chthoniobacterales bacterium]
MEDVSQLVRNSSLYNEFLAERAEILRHKWIESEKAGYDIGFEHALMDWIVKYRSAWFRQRQIFRQKGLGCSIASGSNGIARGNGHE